MKISNRIFWGFWGSAALLIVGFIAAFSSVTRAWVAPDGKQLRDASSLTGPWKDQVLSAQDFSSLQLNGAFDVAWEQSDTLSVTLSVPERFSEAFSMRQDGTRLVFTNRLTGRFSELALRLKISGPRLSEVEARKSLKLKLNGHPGESLNVSGNGAVWIEGTCATPMERLSVSTRGMTILQMKSCPMKRLFLDIHGKIVIHANVTESLEGAVNGSGDIRLSGAPARQNLSQYGSVRIRID